MAMTSLCETCRNMREVVSGTGSRFLLCKVSQTDPRFKKYPMQPITSCLGYAKRDAAEDRSGLS